MTTPSNQVFVVNSLSGSNAARNHLRGVTVTPLATQPTVQPVQQVTKVLLKAVAKYDKKKSKTFTLRNISAASLSTCATLKFLIRAQLQEDIISSDFDVGYVNGTNIVSLRSGDDLAEIWSRLLKGDKLVLWCDGLGTGGSRKRKATDSDSDEGDAIATNSSKKRSRDREDRVQELLDSLKKEHGDKFTVMQYRIWSEMIAGGMHGSTSEPPTTSMFGRAGCVNSKKTMTPTTSGVKPSSGESPARVIDNRSKCYKQLGELRSLKESGLLSDEEYATERAAIMSTLKKLTP